MNVAIRFKVGRMGLQLRLRLGLRFRLGLGLMLRLGTCLGLGLGVGQIVHLAHIESIEGVTA